MPVTPFTIEELARLSDEEALRSSSNAGILKALRWVLRFFLVVSIIELNSIAAIEGPDKGPAVPLVIAALNLVLTVGLLFAFRRLTSPGGTFGKRLSWLDPVANLLRVQPRGAALTYLVIQLWLVMLFASYIGDAIAWVIIVPQLLLFFRFAPAERFAMHAIFVLSTVGAWLIPLVLDFSNGRVDHVFAATISNGVALIVGLYITRRSSRGFLSEWRAAREGAREQIRMRQELESAREIQLSMLPRETPDLDWSILQVSPSRRRRLEGTTTTSFFLPETGWFWFLQMWPVTGSAAGSFCRGFEAG